MGSALRKNINLIDKYNNPKFVGLIKMVKNIIIMLNKF